MSRDQDPVVAGSDVRAMLAQERERGRDDRRAAVRGTHGRCAVPHPGAGGYGGREFIRHAASI